MTKKKRCGHCDTLKDETQFYTTGTKSGGRRKECKKCFSRIQAARAAKRRKTKVGLITLTYSNMQSRVRGQSRIETRHLFEGLELVEKETFITWALEDEVFHELYNTWVESGYKYGLTPTLSRIYTQEGYTLLNMNWVTQSHTGRKAALWGHYGQII